MGCEIAGRFVDKRPRVVERVGHGLRQAIGKIAVAGLVVARKQRLSISKRSGFFRTKMGQYRPWVGLIRISCYSVQIVHE